MQGGINENGGEDAVLEHDDDDINENEFYDVTNKSNVPQVEKKRVF